MSAEKRIASPKENDPILPEDIATLYSWANLHGIQYRDFSATRQEFRSRPSPVEMPLAEPEAAPESAPQTASETVPETPARFAWAELLSMPPTGGAAEAPAPSEPDAPHTSSGGQGAATTGAGIAEQGRTAHEPVGAAPAVTEIEARIAPAQPELPAVTDTLAGQADPVEAVPAQAPTAEELTVEELTTPPARAVVKEPAPQMEAAPQRGVEEPAWMASSAAPQPEEPVLPARPHVSARWYALNRIAGHLEPYAHGEPTLQAPILAVFSLAGGVGKTGIVATLGRALAARGETALLVDANPYGLLHVYYGAQESRPGVVRSFTSGGPDAPVELLSMRAAAPPAARFEDLPRAAGRASRVLVDVATASVETVRQLARYNPQVLVPLTPDMHSLASLQALEDCFAQIEQGEGRRIEPVYLLNCFDPSLALHAEIRELLSQRLGERLLPFALHRAPLVSEALAEGMTVMDYSPGALIAEDYASLASWVRRSAAPADGALRGRRWSEQERS